MVVSSLYPINWYNWITVVSFTICIIASLSHIFKLIRLGNPTDYSKQAGDISKSVKYSFTKAMSPAKKESAFLHLPTYTAGIIYHLGTFLAIFFFFIFHLNITFSTQLNTIFSLFFVITGISGIGILIKRMYKKNLLALSNPDDFISNILVTVFQFATAYLLLDSNTIVIYSIISSLLLLYLPMGKLKHAYYFFCSTISFRLLLWMEKCMANFKY